MSGDYGGKTREEETADVVRGCAYLILLIILVAFALLLAWNLGLL